MTTASLVWFYCFFKITRWVGIIKKICVSKEGWPAISQPFTREFTTLLSTFNVETRLLHHGCTFQEYLKDHPMLLSSWQLCRAASHSILFSIPFSSHLNYIFSFYLFSFLSSLLPLSLRNIDIKFLSDHHHCSPIEGHNNGARKDSGYLTSCQLNVLL